MVNFTPAMDLAELERNLRERHVFCHPAHGFREAGERLEMIGELKGLGFEGDALAEAYGVLSYRLHSESTSHKRPNYTIDTTEEKRKARLARLLRGSRLA
jgi:hypothetical protein